MRERRRKTEDLPDNDLVHSLVEAHPEPFALIDPDFNIVACNRKYAEAYTDLSPEEIVGMKCHEVSHKSTERCELNGEECPLERVLDSNAPVQVVHQHYDRSHDPYYVTVYGSPVGCGEEGCRFVGEAMTPISSAEDLTFDEEKIVGCCPSFMTMLDNLSLVARSDLPVLVSGETGTGKELAARFLHRKSPRCDREFVTIDCATLAEDMFVAELFGHEAGAYTGCIGVKAGLVELADGGTLFLDEIGETSLDIQAKLLRILDRGTFRRLGSNRERKVDFRLICATNRDLRDAVQAGTFRADLFYRINSMQVTLPPLRHRRDDIAKLVEFFLRRLMPGQIGPLITAEALQRLRDYAYPGNVRELKHILERAVLVSRHQSLEPTHLPREIRDARVAGPGARSVDPGANHHDHVDGGMVQAALARFGGNRRKTAAFLKISERTLYRRLRDLGLA
jgi:transcriptional regulator with PAS, ATPase and Fis domain